MVSLSHHEGVKQAFDLLYPKPKAKKHDIIALFNYKHN
jgi:hypothetical protein